MASLSGSLSLSGQASARMNMAPFTSQLSKSRLIFLGLAFFLPLGALISGEPSEAELVKKLRSGDVRSTRNAFSEAKSRSEISDEIWKAALEVFLSAPKANSQEDAAFRLIESLALKSMAAKASPKTVAESLRPLLAREQTVWFAAEIAGVSPAIAGSLVPELIKVMGNSNKSVRYFAVRALGTAGEAASPAVPNLVDALLNDPSEDVRQFSAESLGKIGDTSPATINALIGTLLKDNGIEGMYADEALVALQFDPKPYLEQWIKCADLLVTPDSLRAKMPQLGNAAIAPIVEHAKAKPIDEIVTEAILLAALEKDAIPALTPLLSSKNDHERFLAFSALADIRNRSGDSPEWIEPYLEDENLNIRFRAIRTYTESNAPMDKKLALLSKKLAGSNGEERRCVAGCIGDLSVDAKPLLRQMIDLLGTAKDDDCALGVAILAIQPHSQDGLAAVQKSLNSPDDDIASDALWELSLHPEVGKLFIAQLRDIQKRPSISEDRKQRIESMLSDFESNSE